MDRIRIFEAFAGYGSQSMALERIKNEGLIDYEVVGISEIDKYAIKAYYACHSGDIPNFGDISAIDWELVPDFDLFTYSFPCQDISRAGNMMGMSEGSGTRSSLLWECRKAIAAKRPGFLLMENVRQLIGRRTIGDFRKWCGWLETMGYTNSFQVLDSSDYGVPQQRKRVFMVSVLNSDTAFEFPAKTGLERRIGDIVEKNVDERYYLKKSTIQRIIDHCERKQAEGCGFKTNFKTVDDICSTITSKVGQRETDPHLVEIAVPVNLTDSGVAHTITTRQGNTSFKNLIKGHAYSMTGVMEYGLTPDDIRVRRFTPRECYRLMDVSEEDIEKLLASGLSNTRHYKLAGNSIVVSVLYHIFKKLFAND